MKIMYSITSILLVLLISGCSSTQINPNTQYGKGVSERRLNNLVSIIKRDHNCIAESYEYNHKEGNLSGITACGKEFQYILTCSGYCYWLSIEDLKQRASFDIGCDEEIKIKRINDNTWGVSGCGNKAVYMPIRTSGQMNWILNGSSGANGQHGSQPAIDAANGAANAASQSANHMMHHTPAF